MIPMMLATKIKKMYNPFVVKANDGTWRALWSVNQHAPQFAVAYSEDLIPSRRVINLENAGLIRFPVKKLRISDGIFVILLMALSDCN